MGKPNKVKNQKSSLWTTTLEDIDKNALPKKQVEKAIKHIKENDIDINKPAPEIEKLAKIFKPER